VSDIVERHGELPEVLIVSIHRPDAREMKPDPTKASKHDRWRARTGRDSAKSGLADRKRHDSIPERVNERR